LEAAIAAQELSGMSIEDALGAPSRFSCPECHRTLWEIAEGDSLRYRSHVGHALTADTMLTAQDEDGEQLLWRLLRSHQERAELAHRMAERERPYNPKLSVQMQQRGREYEEDAALVRRLLRAPPRQARRATEGDPI